MTKEETDELEVEKEAVAEDGIEAAAEKPEADKGAVAAAEAAADEPEADKEAAAPEYPRSYEAPLHPIAKRESLIKRLRPYYLTAAGLLLDRADRRLLPPAPPAVSQGTSRPSPACSGGHRKGNSRSWSATGPGARWSS